MYDPKNKRFKNVEGFTDFPSPEKLDGTGYYYSDHKMGCAGGMWGSELFYIKNFKAVATARIYIVTCHKEDYETGVFIYDIQGKKEKLTARLKSVPLKYNDDSDYFMDYWGKNYKKFE